MQKKNNEQSVSQKMLFKGPREKKITIGQFNSKKSKTTSKTML